MNEVSRSSIRAWYVVVLLALLFTISFIDRLILALLAVPVKKELALSDPQLGILLGAGFAFIYSLAGLPIGQLLDRHARVKIVGGGVLLWCAATIASAFASGFAPLLACRAGVAIGEAVLSPAAVSIIADLFPRDRRAGPMIVYSSVSAVMGTGAFIVGAAALQLATAIAPSVGLVPWRVTLVLVGSPGILLAALLLLSVREPTRSGDHRREEAGSAAFFHYLRDNAGLYGSLMLGTGLLCCYVFGMSAWIPSILVRAYGYTTTEAGYAYGAIGVPTALAATVFWPWLAGRLSGKGTTHGLPSAFVLLALPLTPVLIATPLMPSAGLFLAMIGLVVFCGAGLAILPQLVFQQYGPSRMRARLTALNLLGINLLGFAIGPVAISTLGGLWPSSREPLTLGLSTVGAVCGPLALLCFVRARRAARGLVVAAT